MSFNDEQTDYCKYLASLEPEQKCWCGWFKLGECPHCGPGKTAADKMKVWCPECHNVPRNGQPIVHVKGCTLDPAMLAEREG